MSNDKLTIDYWMNIVEQVAKASTCRVNIGCVLIQDNHIAGVGYLGSITGAPHCDDVGCLYVDAPHQGSGDKKESCIRTIHAETNAVMDYLRRGSIFQGPVTSFSTYSPCLNCFKLMVQTGIRTFYFQRKYKDEWRDKLLYESFNVHVDCDQAIAVEGDILVLKISKYSDV